MKIEIKSASEIKFKKKNKSSLYSAEKWKSSVLEVITKYSGQYTTKKALCDLWKEETPNAPNSNTPGSFYVLMCQFEDAGMVGRDEEGYIIRICNKKTF